MKDKQLIEAFEIHAQGKIVIHHHPADPKLFNMEITLEDFYRMFELVREKRANAVTQD